jgi:Uri superfamily endonuclease
VYKAEFCSAIQLTQKHRHQMNNQPGVYVLLMRLSAARRLAIGACGKRAFAPGWYAYVGSAHGPGGLKRRTDRHKAHDKRRQWHIDYLTAAIEIHEIWFAHVGPQREHDWVAILAGLEGAEFPVAGFGSRDCRAGCRAHLLHFKRRPFACVLRACLSQRHPSDPPLCVEFSERSGSPESDADPAAPLMQNYLRGRRYLELRRTQGSGEKRYGAPSAVLGADPLARQLLSRLANEMGVEPRELKKDAELAEAVEKIIGNCGPVAAEIMFDPLKPQQRNSIMKISRTSRERQQHRIEGVATGRMRSVAPQGKDQVPDTVSFREVVSRLERARGDVEASLKLLSTSLDGFATLRQGVAESADEIRKQLPLLGRVLGSLEVVERPTPRKSPKLNPSPGEPSARLQLSQVPRQLKAAIKLIAKNVRDLPARSPTTNIHGGLASSYDLRPTSEELRRAGAEIRRISTAVKAILHALSGK